MWQESNNGNSNAEIRNQFPEVWEQLQALRQRGLRSHDAEYQRVQNQVPGSLLYFYDPSNVPSPFSGTSAFNSKVYFQIVGADADVVLGGTLRGFDFRRRLTSITAPMLITAGRFDRVMIPRYSMRFREYAPQARFVMFERSGHEPFREQPEAFFSVLREFVLR